MSELIFIAVITFMLCATILGVTAIICNRKPQKEAVVQKVLKPNEPTKPEPEAEPKPRAKPELALVPNQKPTHEEIEKQIKAYVANGGTINKLRPSNKKIQPMRQVVLRILSVADKPMNVPSLHTMVNTIDNGIHKHLYPNTKNGRRRFYHIIYNLLDCRYVVNQGTVSRHKALYVITELGMEYLINKQSKQAVEAESKHA